MKKKKYKYPEATYRTLIRGCWIDSQIKAVTSVAAVDQALKLFGFDIFLLSLSTYLSVMATWKRVSYHNIMAGKISTQAGLKTAFLPRKLVLLVQDTNLGFIL